MSQTNYSVERILQLVRASFNEQMGELSYQGFLQRLWRELELTNDPGVVRPPPNQGHPNRPYLYDQAPFDLQAAATEGFFYLLNTGYACPKPGDFMNLPRSEWYRWTERGLQWIKGAEPAPE